MPSSGPGAESFAAWLKAGPHVGDGAMGTMLQQAGLPLDACPDNWNLERPEQVLTVHLHFLNRIDEREREIGRMRSGFSEDASRQLVRPVILA